MKKLIVCLSMVAIAALPVVAGENCEKGKCDKAKAASCEKSKEKCDKSKSCDKAKGECKKGDKDKKS